MRGKDMQDAISETSKGITPAYAGKRLHGQLYNLTIEDHPRLCGEKSQTMLHDFAEKGSPPPMRGKAKAYDGTLPEPRITPAYAGKSFTMHITHLHC